MVATLSATLLWCTAAGPAGAAADTKPEATTTIKCEAASSNREDKDFYDGPSASYMYDKRFKPGPDLRFSELSTFTPQGLTYWKDWEKDEGEGDLLLATAYKEGTREAIIIGLDPKRNDKSATIGVVQIESDHAGGIALLGKWVLVSDSSDGPHTLLTFTMDDLRDAMQASQDSLTEKTPKIEPVQVTKKLYGTSFLAVDSEARKLYAGLFNDKGRDWMQRYTVDEKGSVKEDDKGLRWEIPARTQGLTLTGQHFIFSSSHGRDKRSNLYVTDRREHNLDKAAVRCFRAPSMSQGLATDGDRAYLLFESGSFEYNGHDGERARNVIEGVHKAKLSDLTGLPGGKLHLGTLHSKKQQDRRGNDEIKILVEDQPLGKKAVQIDKGDKKKIDETVQFTGKASVKLYEKDPKVCLPANSRLCRPVDLPDDYLGERTLKPGGKDGIMKFTKHGAHYRLSYKLS